MVRSMMTRFLTRLETCGLTVLPFSLKFPAEPGGK